MSHGVSQDNFGGDIKYQLGMDQDKKIFVAINEDEAKAEAKKFYNKDVDLIRDPDVLDTWFSSGYGLLLH